jgi:hypothetical protein
VLAPSEAKLCRGVSGRVVVEKAAAANDSNGVDSPKTSHAAAESDEDVADIALVAATVVRLQRRLPLPGRTAAKDAAISNGPSRTWEDAEGGRGPAAAAAAATSFVVLIFVLLLRSGNNQHHRHHQHHMMGVRDWLLWRARLPRLVPTTTTFCCWHCLLLSSRSRSICMVLAFDVLAICQRCLVDLAVWQQAMVLVATFCGGGIGDESFGAPK